MLTLQHISKSYGSTHVLRDIDFNVVQGQIVCLLGPSGCGKSTLLRIIAGLDQQDSGTVLLNGNVIDTIPTHQRGFGFMFQDFALFPHRTVAENVAFGLRMQQHPPAIIGDMVAAQLRLVGLDPIKFGNRAIDQLSGGERQRVALARSIAPRPHLLMLDEPLGSLDRALREQLTDDLRTLIKQLGLTAIYVTHDQAEAFALADQIVLMSAGQIAQIGTPAQLYRSPNSAFVARFLGLNNIIVGQVLSSSGDYIYVQTDIGTLCVLHRHNTLLPPSAAVHIIIRPEAAQLPTVGAIASNHIDGQIIKHSFRGATQRIHLQTTTGPALEFDWVAEINAPQLRVYLNPEAISIIKTTVPLSYYPTALQIQAKL